MEFRSPSRGRMSLQQLVADLVDYVAEQPSASYKLIIGTDSQTANSKTLFVTAVVVHRVGKGGRYFVREWPPRQVYSLRQKLLYETALSLEVTMDLKDALLRRHAFENFHLEIHVDAGTSGATRDLIKDLVGMVVASGIDAKIKPDSFGASKVADRFTK